jgi:hypothetical protein
MKPSDTPRSDAHVESRFTTWDTRSGGANFARELERELAAAHAALESMPTCRCGLSTDEQCSIAAALQSEREHADRLAGLLNAAKCPACDGAGWYAEERGGVGPDGENDTRECIQVQCQWCDESKGLLAAHAARRKGTT